MRRSKLLAALGVFVLAATVLVGGTASAAPDDEPASRQLIATTSGPSQEREDVAKADIRQRTGRLAAAGAVSYRHYWGSKNGWWTLNLTGLGVSAGQSVMVSATESDGAGGEFIGDAKISIYNVAVTDNAVKIRIHIDYGSPINVWVHYLG